MVKIFSAIFMCFALLSPVYGDNTQDLLSGLIDKYTGLPAIQNKSKDIIEAQTKNINPIVQNYLQILQDQADQGDDHSHHVQHGQALPGARGCLCQDGQIKVACKRHHAFAAFFLAPVLRAGFFLGNGRVLFK